MAFDLERLRSALRGRQPRLLSELPPEMPAARRAAVLVPLYLEGGRPFLVLTRRTDGLSQHAGQISFPGGSCDPGDADATATALREAEEEIGLAPRDVEVLGLLDRIETITRFRVTPVVGVIPAGYAFRPAGAEVAEILRLPLDDFLAPGAERVDDVEILGRRRRMYAYTVEGRFVWGATGRMVRGLLELVAGG